MIYKIRFLIWGLSIIFIIFITISIIQIPIILNLIKAEHLTNQMNSYEMTEEFESFVGTNGTKYGDYATSSILINKDPLQIKIIMNENVDYNRDPAIYYLEENSKLYEYKHDEEGIEYIKSEISYDAIKNYTMPLTVIKRNVKKTSCDNYRNLKDINCYTMKFKIKNLSNTEQENLRKLIQQITGEINVTLLERITINQNVVISKTNIITLIEYDFSELFKEYLKTANKLVDSTIDLKVFYRMTIEEKDDINFDYVKADEAPNYIPIENDGEEINPIEIGDTYNGLINSIHDVDYYQFSLTEEKTIYFWIDSFFPIELHVYDQDKKRIESLLYLSHYELTLKPGTYHIMISSFNHHGEYTFGTKENLEDDFRDDPVDNYSPLQTISSTTELNGKINYQGDIDLFKIQPYDEGLYKLTKNDTVDIFLVTMYLSTNKYYVKSIDSGAISIMPDSNKEYFIAINSQFEISRYNINIELFDEANDITDDINTQEIPQLHLNNALEIQFNKSYDSDILKIQVEEDGIYNISLSELFKDHSIVTTPLTIEIYDSNKNSITFLSKDFISKSSNYAYQLNKGIYYLKITSSFTILNITAKLVIDDYTDSYQIGFNDLSFETNITFNYSNDLDQFTFTVTDPTYLQFDIDNSDNAYYIMDIFDQYGNEVINEQIDQYYFFPGEYLIKFSGYIHKTIKLTITMNDSIIDDYIDRHKLGTQYLGNLLLGENKISIDYPDDQDVYIFKVDEAGVYLFNHSTIDLSIYYYKNNQLNRYSYNEYIFLEEGIYYFYFNNKRAVNTPVTVYKR